MFHSPYPDHIVYCATSLIASPDSKYLDMVEQKLAGAIVLNLEPDGKNTPTSIIIWKLIAIVMLHYIMLVTRVTNKLSLTLG